MLPDRCLKAQLPCLSHHVRLHSESKAKPTLLSLSISVSKTVTNTGEIKTLSSSFSSGTYQLWCRVWNGNEPHIPASLIGLSEEPTIGIYLKELIHSNKLSQAVFIIIAPLWVLLYSHAQRQYFFSCSSSERIRGLLGIGSTPFLT